MTSIRNILKLEWNVTDAAIKSERGYCLRFSMGKVNIHSGGFGQAKSKGHSRHYLGPVRLYQ